MRDFRHSFKHHLLWLIPLWALAGYLGWQLGEALAIIQKLGEGL